MPRHTPAITALVFVCLAGVHFASEVVAEDEKTLTDNANTVLQGFPGKLKFSCSSFYTSWGVEKAFDGKPLTSWFSASGDSAAQGKKPWVAVEFPMAATVRRVTLLSNREPYVPNGLHNSLWSSGTAGQERQSDLLASRSTRLGSLRYGISHPHAYPWSL